MTRGKWMRRRSRRNEQLVQPIMEELRHCIKIGNEGRAYRLTVDLMELLRDQGLLPVAYLIDKIKYRTT